MPRWWLSGLLGLFAALLVVYLVSVLRARPAVNHPLFAAATASPLVIAHRGGMHLWPENTVYAFQRAVELGADMLEMDLHTTLDGVIVVLHDVTVDRTTDGTGRVRALTVEQLKELDAGARWSPAREVSYPYRGAGLTVPTLAEVFTAVPNTRFNLEIKQREPSLVPELCRLIRAFGMQNRALVASFHGAAVREFREKCPEVATSATPEEARRFVALQLLPLPAYVPRAQALQVPERLGRLPILTRPLVRAARAANLRVHGFTINRREDLQRLLRRGVDGLVTDRPDLMLELLDRRRDGIAPCP
jgi:glycerophosphoryl diester phosphodiesterase